jgi:phosphatidylserine decarboxylase
LAPLSGAVFGWAARRWFSRRWVPTFASSQGVDPETLDRPLQDYPNLEALFSRAVPAGARPIAPGADRVVSPCDGVVSVWSCRAGAEPIVVKGAAPDLAELLADPDLSARLDGAAVVVVRLAPGDLHRVVVPIEEMVGEPIWVGGPLHSVHPMAARAGARPFRNRRVVLPLGADAALVAIGAFHVGSVEVVPGATGKGAEVAVFHLGGSAVVLAVADARWDADLLEASARGEEVRVRMGEVIGRRAGARPRPLEPPACAASVVEEPGLLASLDVANGLTLASLVVSFLAIVVSLEGWIRLAFVLVGASSVLDAVDGWAARRFGMNNLAARKLGRHLDNLVDAIAFGVAPAIVLYQAGLSGWFGATVLAGLPVAAVLRLAWFVAHGKTDRFRGLPSTATGVLVPVVGLVGLIDGDLFRVAAALLAVGLAVGMVTPWQVRRPGPVARVLLGALAVVTALAWVVLPNVP